MPQTVKFTADLAGLKRAVNFVRNGLGSSKTDLPVMLVRCNVTGGKLTMFAANKEMFARTELRITREDDEEPADGSFAVLGAKLVNLINATETERVSFDADPENLKVNAGFLTVNLVLYDGASLKQAENAVSEHLMKDGEIVDRSSFEEALSCAKACTTINSIRPDVTHVELRKGKVLSSDGRKIMIYTPQSEAFGKAAFKCPAGTLNSLVSAIKNVEAEKVQVTTGGTYYYVRTGLNEFSLGVRKTERDFPDVEAQLTHNLKPEDEISVDKNVLTNMLNGVSLGLDTDEVKVQIDADGTKPEGYLEISAKNSLGRRSFERTSCGRTGTVPTSFPVSYRHLLDTLSVFKGDSVVDFLVVKARNLLIVHDKTPQRVVTTVIPFRTDAQVEQEKKEAAAAEEARKKASEVTTKTDSTEEGTAALAEAVEQDIDLET